MCFLVRFKKEGRIYTQRFYASDEKSLYVKLQKDKVFVLEVSPKRSFLESIMILNPPRLKDLINVFYQLKLGLRAKMPLLEVLENTILQIHNPLLKLKFQKVLFGLQKGKTLPLCFLEAGFEDFIYSMIEIGHKSGRLIEVLEFIILGLKNRQKNQKLFKKILLYPLFVSVVMVLVFLGITIFVLPQFESLFLDFHAHLPLVSRSLLFMRTLVIEWGLWIIFGVCPISFIGIWFYKHSLFFQEMFSKMVLSLPFLGKVIYHYAISQFLLSFYWLYRSKIPLEEVLRISSKGVENVYLRLRVEDVYGYILKGVCIAESFEKSGIWDRLTLGLIHSAKDEEGFLESLEVVLDLHKEELQTRSEALIASLEPLMIVFLGLLVLWLALGIFLPLWELPLKMKEF